MEQEEPQLEPVPKSTKVQLRCPFPQCPKQLKWRSLKTHIRSIVENGGYDDAHPRTDTLWVTPYVEKLLSTCAPKADNPEVQKARIKASSRKYYQKNRVGILLRKAKERENFRTQMAASLTCSPRNVSNSVDENTSTLPADDASKIDLLTLKQSFELLHEDHQNKERCLDAINWLIENDVPRRDALGSLSSLSENLKTEELLLSEVVKSNPKTLRLRDSFSELENGGWGKEDFLKAYNLFKANPGTDPNLSFAKPVTLWDYSLNVGGRVRRLLKLPNHFKDGGYTFQQSGKGKRKQPTCTLTATPAGTISDPHIDQTGSGTLLFEVFGIKLFIAWPSTPHNLRWMTNKYGTSRGTILNVALKSLENPFYFILQRGQYQILGPGYIHAVFSPINSAVAGMKVVHSDFREEAEKAMEWEKALIDYRRSSAADPLEQQSAESVEKGLNSDRRLWAQHDQKYSREKQ